MLSGFLSRRKEREDEDISLNNNSKPVTMSIADDMKLKTIAIVKKLICSLRHIYGPRKAMGGMRGREGKHGCYLKAGRKNHTYNEENRCFSCPDSEKTLSGEKVRCYSLKQCC